MPMTFGAPVLEVDANVIRKTDTTNPANIFCNWTVFATCRDLVAQGRRLENLGWRLWNRETLYCRGEAVLLSACAASRPQNNQQSHNPGSKDLGQLRGREHHITSDELEKLIVSIVEARVPLNAPLLSVFRSTVMPQWTGLSSIESPDYASGDASLESVPSRYTLAAETQSRTIVTRGFSPSEEATGSITSTTSMEYAIPGSTDAPAPKRFALGSSSCLGDTTMQDSQQLQRPVSTSNEQKKIAPCNSQINTQSSYDDSALYDDDENWESAEESDSSIAEDDIFRRVNLNTDYTSRKSLISLTLKRAEQLFIKKDKNAVVENAMWVLTLEDQPAYQGDLGREPVEGDVAHADSAEVEIGPGVVEGYAGGEGTISPSWEQYFENPFTGQVKVW